MFKQRANYYLQILLFALVSIKTHFAAAKNIILMNHRKR